METAGFEVNSVMTSLTRSLRDYVRTQDFAENRRLLELLRETRAIAATAVEKAQLSPIAHLDTPLTRIGMTIGSISALKLKNPGEEFVESDPLPLAEAQVNTEAILESVRASEIDFAELKTNIAAVLKTKEQATIAEVLAEHPATQGLASVVGLVYLGMAVGTPLEHSETVSWTTEDSDMSATITGWQFHRAAYTWEEQG